MAEREGGESSRSRGTVAELGGNERFQLIRQLGAGGMGVVFEALDRESGSRVALKVLPALEPHSLLRFKNEFRLLRDVRHPNLVVLRELLEDRGRWFFTMELVEGDDFLEYVRPGGTSASSDAETADFVFAGRRDGEPTRAAAPGFDDARLRKALRQLARGLAALHSAGRVHRDVKPSNVLVTPPGRVVLLDFGLAVEIAPADRLTGSQQFVGTLPYMAPEQGQSAPVGPAADWYAFGTVLYEALTGTLPFRGRSLDVLVEKERGKPRAPGTLVTGLPVDLERLCLDLLDPDPAERPTGQHVLDRLGPEPVAVPDSDLASPRPAGLLSGPFVGRKAELGALEAMFDATRRGSSVTVLIHGESGVGKSALLRRFARNLRGRDADAVVLTGRCFERESVPYRALDAVVDGLSQILTRLSKTEAARLVPLNAALLGEVFPVLLRVDAIARAPAPKHKVVDPQERRTRAFASLRELLARLAERHAVLIAVDDLQWADADSLALLREILRVPDAPAMLVAATLRTAGELDATPPAAGQAAVLELPGDVREIRMGPLPPDEASELAATLLDVALGGRTETAARIGSEAGGHPLFIQALVHHTLTRSGSAGATPFRLEEALRVRIGGFDADARRLLALVAVAGLPITMATAARGAAVQLSELDDLANPLAAASLVRMTGARPNDLIELYHDRIREAVLAGLDPGARKDLHERLAVSLMATETDFEMLAIHWNGAGEPARARKYAVLAAGEASQALAFERAVRLYRSALALEIVPPAESWVLRARLGEALANAGRPAEAAEELLSAAADAETAGIELLEVVQLRRQAAEHYLRSFRFDEGVTVLRSVLASVGLKYAKTPVRALASILLRRPLIRLHRLAFRERHRDAIPALDLARADTCYSAAAGLGYVDVIRGMDFHTRHFLLALAIGEPARIVRALAFETGYSASRGTRSARRTAWLRDQVRMLSARLDQPDAIALRAHAEGMSYELEGRFRSALASFDEAERIFRERCKGVASELVATEIFADQCLWLLGEWAELSRRVPLQFREAEERGDVCAAALFRTGASNFVWLASDDPARAMREADEAMRAWTRRDYHLQHNWDTIARTEIALYLGKGREAHSQLVERWPVIARSLLLRVQLNLIDALNRRGRCAVAAAAAGGGDRDRLVRDAEACARRIERERTAYGHAFATSLRAGVASVRNEAARAAELFAEATAAFESADMTAHAAATRRRQGEIVGGEQGAGLVAAADAFMATQGIREPVRIAALLAP